MEPVTCSVQNAATALGVCQASIYNWMKAGRIESVKVGRRRLVKIDSVRNLVEAA
jgi:excisionase family DNA binding protein